MKKLTALVLLLLIIAFSDSTVFGQSLYQVNLDEKLSNASLIVEGHVLDQTSFWNERHSMIYTSSRVEVYKLFKGQLASQVIEVMTQGGTVGNESIVASDLVTLTPNQTGVFFCFPNSIGLRSPQSGNIMFDIYSSGQGFFEYNLPLQTASAPFVRYKNIKNELYPELQKRIGNAFQIVRSSFDVTNFANSPNNPQAPSITSFSPTSIHAGALLDPTNNVLTINGTGFGTGSGSAAVLFDNPDDGPGGSLTPVAFNSPLIISWSDTQIKVRVPGKSGTGSFFVQDAGATLSGASATLDVVYGVQNVFWSGNTIVKESNLMNDNGSGGYTILYSTNTAGMGVDFNASTAKATFQRALTTWKEVAGFNVTEGGTTTNQVINPSDGVNVIMFDNANTGNPPLASGVLAVCYSFYGICGPIATNEMQKTEFDVVVRNNGFSAGSTTFTIGPCPPRSSSLGEIDLETVILHELGHAIGHEHIIDGFEGSALPQINPGKLMNFSVVNGVKRSSPDYSAYAGALYMIAPQGNTYGACLDIGEMTPLATTTEPKDECPGSFPTTVTPMGTVVSFDLVHATSDKYTDPQYTDINCAGTGTGVTNNAYYAFKTGVAGGTLTLTVSGYATTPAAQAGCTFTGVELAIYQVSSCPAGQSYPAPIACRTFNANGALSNITGLAANTNYLLFADGIENTKANFSLTFNGTALPINISSFTGSSLKDHNTLEWKIDFAKDVQSIFLEKSDDGRLFDRIATVTSTISSKGGDYNDFRPFISDNFYRLAVLNQDGTVEYSKVLNLRRDDQFLVSVFPNPAHAILNVEINSQLKGNYFVRLRNSLGQEVIRKNIQLTGQRSTLQFALANLPSGVYQVSIYDQHEKLIKTNSVTVE